MPPYTPGEVIHNTPCPICGGIVKAGEEVPPSPIATGGDPTPPQTTRILRAYCRACASELRYDTSADRLWKL